jgi:hypothetical protein
LYPAGKVWKPVGEGNLVLATSETGKLNKIIFAAGGLTAGTTQMEIFPNEKVKLIVFSPVHNTLSLSLQLVLKCFPCSPDKLPLTLRF